MSLHFVWGQLSKKQTVKRTVIFADDFKNVHSDFNGKFPTMCG